MHNHHLERFASWAADRFELSRDGGEGNIRSMEGLRGLAVFLVFLVHAPWFMRPWIEPGSWIATASAIFEKVGKTGVDIFFVLSGYLIYGSLVARPQPFTTFMLRRARRLYPAFLAVFTIYVAGAGFRKGGSEIPSDPSAAVLYIVENLLFLPGLFPIRPLITAAWSLSYEVFFYIVCALVVNRLNMQAWSKPLRLAFLLTALTTGAAVFGVVGGPVRLGMFLFGAILHELAEDRPLKSVPPILATAVFAAGLCSALFRGRPMVDALMMLLLGSTCFLFCGVIFHAPATWLAASFRWTPLRWFGNISYSYYLLHSLVLTACTLVLGKIQAPEALPNWLLVVILIAMFAATLLGSAVLFLLVERPFSLASKPRRQVRVKVVSGAPSERPAD